MTSETPNQSNGLPLERINPQHGRKLVSTNALSITMMNLHRCHKPTPTRTGLSPHRLYITFKTSWFYFERLQNEIAK